MPSYSLWLCKTIFKDCSCFFSQLVDVQLFAAPRIILKPLVPTFPCFASVAVSLMEKVTET